MKNSNKGLNHDEPILFDIGDIDKECIDYIEKSINELEVKINNINNDIMYKWYKSDESGRNNIMKFLTAKQPSIE